MAARTSMCTLSILFLSEYFIAVNTVTLVKPKFRIIRSDLTQVISKSLHVCSDVQLWQVFPGLDLYDVSESRYRLYRYLRHTALPMSAAALPACCFSIAQTLSEYLMHTPDTWQRFSLIVIFRLFQTWCSALIQGPRTAVSAQNISFALTPHLFKAFPALSRTKSDPKPEFCMWK